MSDVGMVGPLNKGLPRTDAYLEWSLTSFPLIFKIVEGERKFFIKGASGSLINLTDALDADEDAILPLLFVTAREIIFAMNESGGYSLTVVAWAIDEEYELQLLTPVLSIGAPTIEALNFYIYIIAELQIPVVANTSADSDPLVEVFNSIASSGVRLVHSDSEIGYVTARFYDAGLGEGSTRHDVATRIRQPAETALLGRRLLTIDAENRQARQAIHRLDKSIAELRDLLQSDSRNENDLQRCITSNPHFFGPSYRRIIPKHRLGSEYEVDYALELVDGSVDFVEIEASTHRLYTRQGNPSGALVHAEQQVLDWLAWLDEHSAYARSSLPGIRRPRGIVVIGRRTDMNAAELERLRWRNLTFGDRLAVLTFDDLIDRAEALRGLLTEEVSRRQENGGDSGVPTIVD